MAVSFIFCTFAPHYKYPHMRILYIIILCFVLTTLAVPRAEGRRNEPVNNTDSILAVYTQYLEDLVANQSIQGTKQSSSRLNPYLFRLFAPGTLYRSALQQSMSLANDDTDTSLPDTTLSQYAKTLPSLGEDNDRQLVLNELLNEQLNKAYILRPGLFATTQDDLMNTSKLRSDLSQKMEEEKKIAEKVIEEVPDVQIEAVEPDVKRPNFWTFKGNGGLQFTQNYFSRNWYQGGENNYSMLACSPWTPISTTNARYSSTTASKHSWDSRPPRAATPNSAPPAISFALRPNSASKPLASGTILHSSNSRHSHT